MQIKLSYPECDSAKFSQKKDEYKMSFIQQNFALETRCEKFHQKTKILYKSKKCDMIIECK